MQHRLLIWLIGAALMAGEPAAVFLGDSYTDNWRNVSPFPGKPYTFMGYHGATSRDLMTPEDGQPAPIDQAIAQRPAVILLLAGINDFGQGLSPESVVLNLAAMGEKAQKAGIRVVLCTEPPVGAKADTYGGHTGIGASIKALNAQIAALAKQRAWILCDYYPDLAGPDGFRLPQYHHENPEDALHPGPKAYEKMAVRAQAAIAEAVAPAPAGKARQPR